VEISTKRILIVKNNGGQIFFFFFFFFITVSVVRHRRELADTETDYSQTAVLSV
jgi:hypothetical protein